MQGATGSGINLDGTQVEAVAAFLRVINALENLRASNALLQTALAYDEGNARRTTLIRRATFELQDAIDSLVDGGLHPQAANDVMTGVNALNAALDNRNRESYVRDGITAMTSARQKLEN